MSKFHEPCTGRPNRFHVPAGRGIPSGSHQEPRHEDDDDLDLEQDRQAELRRPIRLATEGCQLRPAPGRILRVTHPKTPRPAGRPKGKPLPDQIPPSLTEQKKIYANLWRRDVVTQLLDHDARVQSSLVEQAAFLTNRFINRCFPEIPFSDLEETPLWQ